MGNKPLSKSRGAAAPRTPRSRGGLRPPEPPLNPFPTRLVGHPRELTKQNKTKCGRFRRAEGNYVGVRRAACCFVLFWVNVPIDFRKIVKRIGPFAKSSQIVPGTVDFTTGF